jgi:hypothetical protein
VEHREIELVDFYILRASDSTTFEVIIRAAEQHGIGCIICLCWGKWMGLEEGAQLQPWAPQCSVPG